MSAMWNANIHVQDLNLSQRFIFYNDNRYTTDASFAHIYMDSNT